MKSEEIQQVLQQGETQNIEFKSSFAEQDDAIQTLVAFANSKGGKVLFGVKNDGTPVGADIGNNTLENLANAIKGRTYPSLPTFIEQADYDGKNIVVVDCPSDVPPIVGVYLCSPETIPQDSPVAVTRLQAYRRVGRTTQKEDFMRLRTPVSSDPNVVIRLNGAGSSAARFFPAGQGFYYTNSGLGWAFKVSFRVEHPAYRLQTGPDGISLPPYNQETTQIQEHPRRSEVATINPNEDLGSAKPALLKATYDDENGLTWESVLELIPIRREGESPVYYFQPGFFQRRITVFPPKKPRL